MDEPYIERRSVPVGKPKESPLTRSETISQAQSLGIETKGLRTKEIRARIVEKNKEIDAQNKSEDAMAKFIEKVLKDKGVLANQDPPKAPEVKADKTVTREAENLPQPMPLPPRSLTRKDSPATLPPFYPTFTTINGLHYVTVTPGMVIDRVTKNETGLDSVKYWRPEGLMNTDGTLIETLIPSGQCVFIRVQTDEQGAVTVAAVHIGAETLKSVHYIPPVGTTTAGVSGDYYYKLAKFTVEGDGTRTIEHFMSGSNIDHYRELSMFIKSGGTAEIFKEFDPIEGKFKTRGITGGTGITVTQRTDDVLIEENGSGPSFNILLKDINIVVSDDGGGGHWLDFTENFEPLLLYVRNGKFAEADAEVVDEYSFIGRLSGPTGGSNGDTGDIFTPAP